MLLGGEIPLGGPGGVTIVPRRYGEPVLDSGRDGALFSPTLLTMHL